MSSRQLPPKFVTASCEQERVRVELDITGIHNEEVMVRLDNKAIVSLRLERDANHTKGTLRVMLKAWNAKYTQWEHLKAIQLKANCS